MQISASHSNSQRSVLVVDDDVILLEILVQMLEADGHRVYAAADGSDALGVVASVPVDLVLSDIEMPVLDGIELIGALRTLCPGLPVVVMSGSEHHLESALAVGAVASVAKPFSLRLLRETLADAMTATRPSSPVEAEPGRRSRPPVEVGREPVASVESMAGRANLAGRALGDGQFAR